MRGQAPAQIGAGPVAVRAFRPGQAGGRDAEMPPAEIPDRRAEAFMLDIRRDQRRPAVAVVGPQAVEVMQPDNRIAPAVKSFEPDRRFQAVDIGNVVPAQVGIVRRPVPVGAEAPVSVDIVSELAEDVSARPVAEYRPDIRVGAPGRGVAPAETIPTCAGTTLPMSTAWNRRSGSKDFTAGAIRSSGCITSRACGPTTATAGRRWSRRISSMSASARRSGISAGGISASRPPA